MTRTIFWTPEEDVILCSTYPAGGVAVCQSVLPRRLRGAINRRIKRLCLERDSESQKAATKTAWSKAEDNILRRLFPSGGVRTCRPKLPNRLDSAIRRRVVTLKLYRTSGKITSKIKPSIPNNMKIRACLKCSDDFQSDWIGERVCGRCKNGKTWRAALSAPVSSGRRVPRHRVHVT